MKWLSDFDFHVLEKILFEVVENICLAKIEPLGQLPLKVPNVEVFDIYVLIG